MKIKNELRNMTLATTIGFLITGCAPGNSSTGTVSSGFKMTAGSAPATVALNQKPSLFNLLINQAMALVPTSIQDSAGSPVVLSSAWTVIKEIEFKSGEFAGAEDSEIEIEFKGPYVVDLLSNMPLVLDTQLIPQKNIQRIKMKLHQTAVLPAGAPAGLLNNSIFVAGTIAGRNFTFQLNDSTTIQIAGPNSFRPSENSQLLVQIQLANIFKQINMSTVVNNEVISASNRHSGGSLCPSIDASASDIYTCMRKGLEKHAKFGKDNDGDNVLTPNDSSVN